MHVFFKTILQITVAKLMDCPYPFEKSQEKTSFPGFSPIRPYGASRREPGKEAVTRKSSLMYT